MLQSADCLIITPQPGCLLLKIEVKFRISDPLSSLGDGLAKCLSLSPVRLTTKPLTYVFYINWTARGLGGDKDNVIIQVYLGGGLYQCYVKLYEMRRETKMLYFAMKDPLERFLTAF